MLISLARQLSCSRHKRHLLFWGATLCLVTFVGYHFGTFDQGIHLPFLKKYANLALYSNDPFFDLRFDHYSYFWFLFQPFYQLGVLELGMFVVHLLVTYATFWALWTLSETLFHNPLTNVMSVAAFAFPHIGFAAFPVLEFSLLNRTFALPFLLLAIALFLRGRYVLAFALAGLMYNFHVLSVNFVLAMFLLDGVIEFRKVGWRNLGLGLAVFVITALPVLLWKAGNSPIDWSLRPEWLSLVANGVLYNLYYLIAPYPLILISTLSGLAAFAFFVIGYPRPASPRNRTVLIFMLAIVIILVVEVVTAAWLPITIIVQSQIIRAGVFAVIFGYLYFANYLAERYTAGAIGRADFVWLTGAFVFFMTPVIALVIWGLQRIVRPARWRQTLAFLTVAGVVGASLVVVRQYDFWQPGWHVLGENSSWREAQLWARDHTPLEAVFITPPHLWWWYTSDWRVFSERSTVATLSELLEVALMPKYLEIWKPRFEAVAPGALARFRGNYFENVETTAQAYYSLSDEEILTVAQKYGAWYLVVEKPHPRGFPVAYENEGFVIYDLRGILRPR